MKTNKTHWGNVAESYNKYLSSDKNYHSELIIPNLMRMIGEVKNMNVLDVACGQGQISNELAQLGAKVEAFDAGADLIRIAKANNKSINYLVLDAEDFAKGYEGKTFDIIICVLAVQNIENVKALISNIKNVTDKNSKIYFVLNHPAFRIPKYSQWGYDNVGQISTQYRRVDRYMSEDKIKMDMTPGEKREADKTYTYSFHRPLQYYFKLFSNNGLAVKRLEEWISNRESDGKYALRENIARREFPMFMCMEIVNLD